MTPEQYSRATEISQKINKIAGAIYSIEKLNLSNIASSLRLREEMYGNSFEIFDKDIIEKFAKDYISLLNNEKATLEKEFAEL